MQAQLKVPWLPKGVMKAWALRVVSLGTRIARLAAASLVPWLCSSYGWRYVAYVLGGASMGFSFVFQLLAANRPAPGQFEDAPAAASVAKKEKKAVDWGIFSVPAAQVGRPPGPSPHLIITSSPISSQARRSIARAERAGPSR